ncbi:hypothetical protein TNCV_1213291 [Trichonephila clavipes]|nr:hypothetical protein TNCV_1213291 [Trichonephila clavipes]
MQGVGKGVVEFRQSLQDSRKIFGSFDHHLAQLAPHAKGQARGRQRASHGPKRYDASAPHVFPKPVSMVGDTLHAKVGSCLDAFPNRPTTSTRSRTRPPVACSA